MSHSGAGPYMELLLVTSCTHIPEMVNKKHAFCKYHGELKQLP